MSLDHRMKQGLDRSVSGIDHRPIEPTLGEVVVRGHRRRRTRRATAALVAVAAVAAAITLGPKALDAIDGLAETRPATSAELMRQISGTYAVEVEPAEGTVQAFDMAGTWTVRLLPTGAMRISPPAAFLSAWDPPTGSLFTIADGDVRINAFTDLCEGSIATYGLTLGQTHLSLTPLTEDCEPRRVLLTSSWVREA